MRISISIHGRDACSCQDTMPRGPPCQEPAQKGPLRLVSYPSMDVRARHGNLEYPRLWAGNVLRWAHWTVATRHFGVASPGTKVMRLGLRVFGPEMFVRFRPGQSHCPWCCRRRCRVVVVGVGVGVGYWKDGTDNIIPPTLGLTAHGTAWQSMHLCCNEAPRNDDVAQHQLGTI
jgi:hypothetical protein